MASDTFSCPECGATLRYSPNLQAGDPVQCPKCKAEFPVPDSGSVPPGSSPSRPPEEVTGAPGPRRPRFSERADEDYSPSRRPPDHGPARGDYPDEDHPDRPFTGQYSIDINRWFSFAGEHYSAVLGPAIGFIFVAGILFLVPYMIVVGGGQLVASQLANGDPALAFLATQVITQLALLVLMPVLVYPLSNGLSAVCLLQLKGRPWTFGDFFSGFQHFGALAGISLASQMIGLLINIPNTFMTYFALQSHDLHLMMLSPAILLIGLPIMIFVFVRLILFAPTIVFDRNLGAIDAMKANWELTRGHFWGLFGVSLLLGIIYLGGVLACLVGVLFAVPYVVLILNAGYLLITDTRRPADYRVRYDD